MSTATGPRISCAAVAMARLEGIGPVAGLRLQVEDVVLAAASHGDQDPPGRIAELQEGRDVGRRVVQVGRQGGGGRLEGEVVSWRVAEEASRLAVRPPDAALSHLQEPERGELEMVEDRWLLGGSVGCLCLWHGGV